jgi:hypothetical protein
MKEKSGKNFCIRASVNPCLASSSLAAAAAAAFNEPSNHESGAGLNIFRSRTSSSSSSSRIQYLCYRSTDSLYVCLSICLAHSLHGISGTTQCCCFSLSLSLSLFLFPRRQAPMPRARCRDTLIARERKLTAKVQPIQCLKTENRMPRRFFKR